MIKGKGGCSLGLSSAKANNSTILLLATIAILQSSCNSCSQVFAWQQQQQQQHVILLRQQPTFPPTPLRFTQRRAAPSTGTTILTEQQQQQEQQRQVPAAWRTSTVSSRTLVVLASSSSTTNGDNGSSDDDNNGEISPSTFPEKTASTTSSRGSSDNDNNNNNNNHSHLQLEHKRYTYMERFLVSLSQRAAVHAAGDTFKYVNTPSEARAFQVYTFLRVSIPSVISGIVATIAFPGMALFLCTLINSGAGGTGGGGGGGGAAGVFAVLSVDSSQFVQNFLTVAGLLFSILVGQTYYFMYQQQENLYYALFNEVTEAKSLLEQVALVCQGRSMYNKCLDSISQYVTNDLKCLQADPAVLLSARPSEDPLESIMYMTSVGVPSTVYETVRSLRQARASRLGALQRKIPQAHMWLLWVLASLELVSFPLLGAGTQVIGGYNILTVEGVLFGVMTAGIVLTLRVVGELWRPAGGAYNVDSVLTTMVLGLEEELEARRSGKAVYKSNQRSPSSANNNNYYNNRRGDRTVAVSSSSQEKQQHKGDNGTTASGADLSQQQQQQQQQQQGGNIFQVFRWIFRRIRHTAAGRKRY